MVVRQPIDFFQLIEQIQHCTICEKHLPLTPRPVFQAHPKARILIAGQAPGLKVHESGVPFEDASGDRLRDWLGVTPAQFYDPQYFAILPMGFCYPGTGPSGDYPPRPECQPAWRETLLAGMTNIQLTLVLGVYAQKYHLDSQHANLTTTVKAWREFWPKIMPLPHPSPRNNRWLKQNPWFELELLPRLRKHVSSILQS